MKHDSLEVQVDLTMLVNCTWLLNMVAHVTWVLEVV